MRTEFLLLLFVIAIVIILLINSIGTKNYVEVDVGKNVIKAEVADNDLKRMRGLMGRESLQENEGMLFVFDTEGYYSFWMKDMRIPIDIIFMNKNKTVVDIWKDAQPCNVVCDTYTPKEKSMYVLEVKANLTEKIGLNIDSKVDFELS